MCSWASFSKEVKIILLPIAKVSHILKFQTIRFVQMTNSTFGLFTQVSDSGPNQAMYFMISDLVLQCCKGLVVGTQCIHC